MAEMTVAEAKPCNKCLVVKQLTDFFKHKNKIDGRSTVCKDCAKQSDKNWRNENPQKVRERARRHRENNLEKEREREQKYKRNNLEKVNQYNKGRHQTEFYIAGWKLRNAIRIGKVIKPNICNYCQAVGYVEGHHHDYSKPLDVVWLCRKCHGITRRINQKCKQMNA